MKYRVCDVVWVQTSYLDLLRHCFPSLTWALSECSTASIRWGGPQTSLRAKAIVVARVTTNFHISDRGMEVDEGESTHFTFLSYSFFVLYTKQGGGSIFVLVFKNVLSTFLNVSKICHFGKRAKGKRNQISYNMDICGCG